MPYGKDHKEKSRERILESAARLFPNLGYEAVSIDMLMENAGLTRGAFYAHFGNKAEVYAESMVYSAQHSPFRKLDDDSLDDLAWFEQTIAHYLSREHIDKAAAPCPLAFLATDVNHRDGSVRDTYTRLYQNLVKLIRQRLGKRTDRESVMAATAMMIGGVAVARAMNDQQTSDRLLCACRNMTSAILKIK